MTLEELNELVESAHAQINADRLVEVYTRSFRVAGRSAEARFTGNTITAAAWIAPSPPELSTGMMADDRERIQRELEEAQEELAAILLLPFGLVLTAGLAEELARVGIAAFEERVLYDIRRIIQAGVDEGLAADVVAGRLRSEFADLAPDVALSIARTQITALVNEASLRAAKAVDPTIYKTWVTAGDNRVRPAHARAAGQTMPLTGAFQVGGFSMQYPGDPSAPMDMVANCRCVLTYTKKLTLAASAGMIGGDMNGMVEVKFSTCADQERMERDDYTRLGCFVARLAAEKRWHHRLLNLRALALDMPLTADAEPEQVGPSWRAVLGAENSVTPDGRMIAPGSLTPRDFPLPFMALFETGPGGHEGAKLAGRIDAIEMDEHKFVGSGVIDMGDAGQELIRLRQAGMPLGVSFDLAVDELEIRSKDDPFGAELPEEEAMDAVLAHTAVLVFTKGTILGATAAPMQAIDEANEIEILVEDAEGMPSVVRAHAALEIDDGVRVAEGMTAGTSWQYSYTTAALQASAAFPTFPSREWFEKPKLDGPTPMTYTDEGRVFGHLAPHEGCHHGYSTCVPPPLSSYNYAYFMTGELKTAEGDLVPVGKIMFCRDGGKHVDADPRMSAREAAQHYDDATKVGAFVSAGEDEWGIWLAGAVRPGITDEELQHLRSHLPSGDWRPVGMASELIAAFSVPVGGYTIPRADLYLAASANGPDRMQALIITPGMVTEELSEGEIARTIRVLAARAHGPEALAELARS